MAYLKKSEDGIELIALDQLDPAANSYLLTAAGTLHRPQSVIRKKRYHTYAMFHSLHVVIHKSAKTIMY